MAGRNSSASNKPHRRRESGRRSLSRGQQQQQHIDPLVRESIARDLQDKRQEDRENGTFEDSDNDDRGSDSDAGGGNDDDDEAVDFVDDAVYSTSMAASYRRPSIVTSGVRTSVLPDTRGLYDRVPTKAERQEARREERSLLRDNNIIPPKHPQAHNHDPAHEGGGRSLSILGRIRQRIGIPGGDRKVVSAASAGSGDEEAARRHRSSAGNGDAIEERRPSSDPSEDTPLLGNPEQEYGGLADSDDIERKWVEAVAAGHIKTTWQREAKVIARYSFPLAATYFLQYSIQIAGIFTLGRYGTIELGAVSLAGMTAGITGWAFFQGLATALDTLCSQAYGSGRKQLVGLQCQRMVYFLLAVTVPIGVLWLSAEPILLRILPNRDVAVLAARYLRIVLLGAPGEACWESGRRFLQAQGLFSASLYILCVCAPLNAFLHWFLVFRLGWGFVGVPVAVAITLNCLPLGLVGYVYFVDGRQCWPGFTRRAFHNWGPMVRLAVPGMLMVFAEFFAFEILTLVASYFGPASLAAQSVLSTICSLTWQGPFTMSIAASTRIANLIGATLADAAKVSARVSRWAAVGLSAVNVAILLLFRTAIPPLFTNDPEVQSLVARVLPLCAAFQLFDALAANSNGILRGIGRQEIGGYVQLFCYYVVAMPISLATAIAAGWELLGLWFGMSIALALVTVIEIGFLARTDWERSVEDAKRRNELS